jgi:hypothetical protein
MCSELLDDLMIAAGQSMEQVPMLVKASAYLVPPSSTRVGLGSDGFDAKDSMPRANAVRCDVKDAKQKQYAMNLRLVRCNESEGSAPQRSEHPLIVGVRNSYPTYLT